MFAVCIRSHLGWNCYALSLSVMWQFNVLVKVPLLLVISIRVKRLA